MKISIQTEENRENISEKTVEFLLGEVRKWKTKFYNEMIRQEYDVAAVITRRQITELRDGKNVPIFIHNYEPKEPLIIDSIVIKKLEEK